MLEEGGWGEREREKETSVRGERGWWGDRERNHLSLASPPTDIQCPGPRVPCPVCNWFQTDKSSLIGF